MNNTPKRRTVVVDAESSGLGPNHIAIEVAFWVLDTDERGVFIPPHNTQWIKDHAEPEALRINGYWDRIHGRPHDDGSQIARLHHLLRGQCIAGMNVGRADCTWLYRMFQHAGLHPEPWNYRLGEIGPFAAGVLGLPFEDAPGLADLCVMFGIPPEPEIHTAENGVTCEGLVIRELRRRRAGITAQLAAHQHCLEGNVA